MTHLETGVLSGFLRAAAVHPSWSVAVMAWNEYPAGSPDPDLWLVRGRERIAGRSPRVIAISDTDEAPAVWLDDATCGRWAAEHLLDRGFRHLAYRGDPAIPCSQKRRSGVMAAARAAKAEFHDLVPSAALQRRWSVSAEAKEYRRILPECPRPVGLVAFTSHVGRRLIAAAPTEELPHALAIVACDHDPVVAAACRPSLACVTTNAESLGVAAAELAATLLAGRRAPRRLVSIPPTGIAEGGSAAGLAVTDASVLAALECIRRDPTCSVPDVARQCGVSRRVLELRFEAALGTAPGQVMRRRRLATALERLAATDHSVAAVAAACGWASPTRFSADIRAETGLPPQEWRRQARLITPL